GSQSDDRGVHCARAGRPRLDARRHPRRALARRARGRDERDPAVGGARLPAGHRLRDRDRHPARPPPRDRRLPGGGEPVIVPGFRRDRTPGPVGFLDAVLTPLLVVGLVTALALWAYQDNANSQLVLLFGINAIMVIGFQLFTGSTGIVSFGHIAF